MTFGQAIATCFRKYAEFTGRATRPEFWWFVLFTALVSAGLGVIDSALTFPFFTAGEALVGTPEQYGVPLYNGSGALQNLWAIGVLLPSLAATVRRLRDSGRAWGNVFWVLLPVAGWIVLVVQLSQPSVPEKPDSASEGPAGTTS